MNSPSGYAVEIDVDPARGNNFGPYRVPVSAEVRFVMREATMVGATHFDTIADNDAIKFLEIVAVQEIIGPRMIMGVTRYDVVFNPVTVGPTTIVVKRESMVNGPMEPIEISVEIVPEWNW